jgi:hypothetical protein
MPCLPSAALRYAAHTSQDRDIVRWFREIGRHSALYLLSCTLLYFTSGEGDSECRLQVSHFTVPFTAREPSLCLRGVADLLASHVCSCFLSCTKILVKPQSRAGAGKVAVRVARPRHTRPSPLPPNLPFLPHLPFGLCVTHGILAPIKCAVLRTWSDNLHGYLRSTFISSGHLS